MIFCNQKIEYYDTGEIKEVTSYNEVRNKLEIVKVKRYYRNGQLKEEENYKNQKLDGPYFSYCENGILDETSFYRNGLMNGESKYFRCNGTLYGKGRFLNGEKTNIAESSGIPLDGRTGVWKFYYEDGKKILFYQTHRDGMLDGLFKYFSQSGEQISSGFYKNDEKWKGSFPSVFNYEWKEIDTIRIEKITCVDYFQNGQILEDESLKNFLKGYWTREKSYRSGHEFKDNENYSLYHVFNDSSLVFYSLGKNNFDEKYTLIHHSISDINYHSNSIFKIKGEVLLGFDGFYSEGITWKEVIENGGVFHVVTYSDDKIKIIYSNESYEIYTRLAGNNLPFQLEEVLNN